MRYAFCFPPFFAHEFGVSMLLQEALSTQTPLRGQAEDEFDRRASGKSKPHGGSSGVKRPWDSEDSDWSGSWMNKGWSNKKVAFFTGCPPCIVWSILFFAPGEVVVSVRVGGPHCTTWQRLGVACARVRDPRV